MRRLDFDESGLTAAKPCSDLLGGPASAASCAGQTV